MTTVQDALLVKEPDLGHYSLGTSAPWYKGWELTEDQVEVFRQRSRASLEAKAKAERGEMEQLHPVNTPTFDPGNLMPQLAGNGLRTLSLFSGGGGLDLGFDRAGYSHHASIEIMTIAARTLTTNRPGWRVLTGQDGDAKSMDWRQFRGQVDVIQGGPPCQPFSTAGRRRGREDERDLFPCFVQAVLEIEPLAFVAENVPNLGAARFRAYVEECILKPLSRKWRVQVFKLSAPQFGVPQTRTRLFFVGIRRDLERTYQPPVPLFRSFEDESLYNAELPICIGVRRALGLIDIGVDGPAPTMRSGLTGPRHTTSVNSSVSALKKWNRLQIWPNGVAATREAASRFPPKNGHFRLSVPDCALLQGFPEWWRFEGPVYAALGQIGNSVAPPMAYRVAVTLAACLAGRPVHAP